MLKLHADDQSKYRAADPDRMVDPLYTVFSCLPGDPAHMPDGVVHARLWSTCMDALKQHSVARRAEEELAQLKVDAAEGFDNYTALAAKLLAALSSDAEVAVVVAGSGHPRLPFVDGSGHLTRLELGAIRTQLGAQLATAVEEAEKFRRLRNALDEPPARGPVVIAGVGGGARTGGVAPLVGSAGQRRDAVAADDDDDAAGDDDDDAAGDDDDDAADEEDGNGDDDDGSEIGKSDVDMELDEFSADELHDDE